MPITEAAPAAEQMGEAGRIIKAAGVLSALVAPAVMLVKIELLPLQVELLALVLSPIVGIAVTLAIAMQGKSVRRIRQEKAALMLLISVAIGGGLTVGYMLFAHAYVIGPARVSSERPPRYVIPLFPSDALKKKVEGAGGYDLALGSERAETARLMEAGSGATIAVMMLLLFLAQAVLVAAIVGAAWWLAAAAHGKKGAPKKP